MMGRSQLGKVQILGQCWREANTGGECGIIMFIYGTLLLMVSQITVLIIKLRKEKEQTNKNIQLLKRIRENKSIAHLGKKKKSPNSKMTRRRKFKIY